MNYIQISGYGCKTCTKMEVIDLNERKTRICQGSNSTYPKVYGYSGTVSYTNGTILACGDYYKTEQCYFYEKNRGWSELVKLNQTRTLSASIPIDGGMIVTGGQVGSQILKSSQIVFSNGSVITEGKGQNSILIKMAKHVSKLIYMVYGAKMLEKCVKSQKEIVYCPFL